MPKVTILQNVFHRGELKHRAKEEIEIDVEDLDRYKRRGWATESTEKGEGEPTKSKGKGK